MLPSDTQAGPHTAPLNLRPVILQELLTMVRQLPPQEIWVTVSGYGPASDVYVYMPVDTRWTSPSRLASQLAQDLLNCGYAAPESGQEYDCVREEATRLVQEFYQATPLTDTERSERMELGPGMIWMLGLLVGSCDLRSTNLAVYYPHPEGCERLGQDRALDGVAERMDALLAFMVTDETRAAGVVALNRIRERCLELGLSRWWKSTWRDLVKSEHGTNLNGTLGAFRVPNGNVYSVDATRKSLEMLGR